MPHQQAQSSEPEPSPYVFDSRSATQPAQPTVTSVLRQIERPSAARIENSGSSRSANGEGSTDRALDRRSPSHDASRSTPRPAQPNGPAPAAIALQSPTLRPIVRVLKDVVMIESTAGARTARPLALQPPAAMASQMTGRAVQQRTLQRTSHPRRTPACARSGHRRAPPNSMKRPRQRTC